MPADDTGRTAGTKATAAELMDARRPSERFAALTLAAAQRDLRVALASNPEEMAGWARHPEEPPWTDPVAEYVAWVVRMVEAERHARAGAVSSVRACEDYDRSHDRAVGPLAAVIAAAIRRARAAISAILGSNPVLAQRARDDVLNGWPEDDRLAVLALDAGPAEEAR